MITFLAATSRLKKSKQIYVSQTWYKLFAEFVITFAWFPFLNIAS